MTTKPTRAEWPALLLPALVGAGLLAYWQFPGRPAEARPAEEEELIVRLQRRRSGSTSWRRRPSRPRRTSRPAAEADRANSRLNGTRLEVAGVSGSPGYVCGKQHVEDKGNLKVIYGLRDGTSRNVPNVNFYKELRLTVPAKPPPPDRRTPR